jgi:hypothetical protein
LPGSLYLSGALLDFIVQDAIVITEI